MKIELPKAYKELPYNNDVRYKVYYGGRGSGKSTTIATQLIIDSMAVPNGLRILCAREFQNSMKDSVHKLLSDIIIKYNLLNYFMILRDGIKGVNGTEFIFKGLANNIQSIKSMEGIDIVWLEEANNISESSWNTLIPTIRKDHSQIWLTYNPMYKNDFIHCMVCKQLKNKSANWLIKKVNYNSNPWFPEVLRKEMESMEKEDYDLYKHVWLGECLEYSNAVIFKNKFEINNCEFNKNLPLYAGADFGFSNDPNTLILCQIDSSSKLLYILKEWVGYHTEIDKLPDIYKQLLMNLPNTKVFGDSSRPETISYISRQGINIAAVKKWPNSVIEGIEFLKSYHIIVNSNCNNIINELRNYKYKQTNNGEILNEPEDKYNHCIDALRYAISPIIYNSRKKLQISPQTLQYLNFN